MPFFERTTSYSDEEDSGKVSTRTHKCDLPDLDYSSVAEGRITCTKCGRYWQLEKYGWWPYPCPGCNTNPNYCHHYGRRKWKKGD